MAQLWQSELLSPRGSQPVRQTWGHTGKLDRIFLNLLKASSKCLYIRLFRKQRHYGEIRNWLGDTNEEQK